MNRLNRRAFLLSTGVLAIAAPVLAKSEQVSKYDLHAHWCEFVEYFDTLPPDKQQQRIDGLDRLAAETNAKFNSGRDVSDTVKKTVRKMKADLERRKKQ